MKNFRELKVWEKAHALALEVYRQTKDFPGEERYELTRQIRRCAVSIPTNIAEGCGRGSDAELARFLQIARGSASELEYTLLLARELGMLKEPAHEALVQRMLAALIKKLTAQSSSLLGCGRSPRCDIILARGIPRASDKCY